MNFHLGSNGLTFFTGESVLIRALSIDSPKPSPNLRNQPLPGESRSSLPSRIDLEISIPAPFFPIMMRCDSPTPVWECDGYCRDRQQLHAAERANIVCYLSICCSLSSQLTFLRTDLYLCLHRCARDMGESRWVFPHDGA